MTTSLTDLCEVDRDTERALLQRIEALEHRLQRTSDSNRMNIVVFDSARDRLLAAFVMATGAAACGMDVSMFFTFWATSALRRADGAVPRKSIVERAFGWMLPRGFSRTRLSKMDMGGMGRLLMSREMKKKNIAALSELVQTAADLGVRIRVCEMSMKLMGIGREELIEYPGLTFCGVASFADEASQANTTMFI